LAIQHDIRTDSPATTLKGQKRSRKSTPISKMSLRSEQETREEIEIKEPIAKRPRLDKSKIGSETKPSNQKNKRGRKKLRQVFEASTCKDESNITDEPMTPDEGSTSLVPDNAESSVSSTLSQNPEIENDTSTFIIKDICVSKSCSSESDENSGESTLANLMPLTSKINCHPIDESNLQCKQCSKQFHDFRRLSMHQEKFHPEPGSFLKCPHCDFSSKFGGKLKSHIFAKHTANQQKENEKLYSSEQKFKETLFCSFCKFSSNKSIEIALHFVNTHQEKREEQQMNENQGNVDSVSTSTIGLKQEVCQEKNTLDCSVFDKSVKSEKNSGTDAHPIRAAYTVFKEESVTDCNEKCPH